jgi:hypothetical protein
VPQVVSKLNGPHGRCEFAHHSYPPFIWLNPSHLKRVSKKKVILREMRELPSPTWAIQIESAIFGRLDIMYHRLPYISGGIFGRLELRLCYSNIAGPKPG